MKVIEIMAQSAMLLGLGDEFLMLENASAEQESELKENKNIISLFGLSKYAFQELCTNYIPVVASVKIKSNENKIEIKNLTNFIHIQNVKKDGELAKYKIINRNIIFEEDAEYEIEYLTYPEINSMFEEVDFLSNFSEDVIVCGLCSYFSLAHGMFDEFKAFHDEYVEKAENLKELKSFNMPQRRWEWNTKSV